MCAGVNEFNALLTQCRSFCKQLLV